MADQITYANKVTSQILPNPATEKIQAADLNEIKSAVNTNATETDTNTANIVTNTADIATNVSDIGTNVTAIGLRELLSNKGINNGYAGLDAGATVPLSQLPQSVKTGSEYKGSWNASTNTPALIDGTGSNGDNYLVEVAGSQDLGAGTIAFNVGDMVIYDGMMQLHQ